MDTTTSALRPLHRALLAALAAVAFSSAAMPASAADEASAIGTTTADALPPGEYEWTPEAATQGGPIVVVVSLPAQMAHVYRGGVRIGRASVSSGKPGHDTPPGIYEILEKDRDHRSNKYNDAPMPYMQRLTWDGVALHSGRNPGYPASHGCVRLPDGFAAQLFEVTEKGGLVVVADEANFSDAVLYPGERVPVDPWTGREPGAVETGVATLEASGAPVLAGK